MRDRTKALARRIRGDLDPGEAVLAAVALALHGTGAAQAEGEGALRRSAKEHKLTASRREAAELGITRGFQFFLVLTDARVLLVRRSAFGTLREVALAVPLTEVAGLRISKQGQAVYVGFADGRELRLETPKAFRFLPPVYEQLPALFSAARSDPAA